MDTKIYNEYVNILKEELVPAMGCTEPISIAYAAANARKALGFIPEHIEIEASPNIIKNVKSVIVPNTGHLRGIDAAAIAGIIAGQADNELEVLSGVTEEQIKTISEYLDKSICTVKPSENGYIFYVSVLLSGGGHTSFVEIAGNHTNIITVKKDDEILFAKDYVEQKTPIKRTVLCLTLKILWILQIR